MHPGIFLDRDGVIIEYRADYVRSWRDVKIYPQALRALTQVSASQHKIAIITNQSAICRKLTSWQTVDEINQRLLDKIREAGGRIDGLYLCPHTPEEGCSCRKPKPGLILQAACELDIDLKSSILIGDNLADLQAGKAAGVSHLVLVRTGLGEACSLEVRSNEFANWMIFQDLEEALHHLVPVRITGGSQ
jgi:D-glycero-D-manno-heptose 1,7-bisphosphate phosphatase